MSKIAPPQQRPPKCVRCRKNPVLADYRPFCSKRCADADLGSWLNGAYAIAGAPPEDTDDAPSGAAAPGGSDD